MKTLGSVMIQAIAGTLALGVVTLGDAAAAEKKTPMEKCHGVVKAGKNDCQTANSACAGTAKKDGQRDAWIYLPKGTCEKIVGASLKPGK